MPSKCVHQAILQICGDNEHPVLIETRRFHRIVHSLPDPKGQYPSVVFFLGGEFKSVMLRTMFPQIKVKKPIVPEDVARLYLDPASVHDEHPTLIADAELTLEVRNVSGSGCHHEDLLPVTWAPSVNSIHAVFDHVVARALLPTANLFVLFVDDFEDLTQVSLSLHRWLAIGVMSDGPLESRPHLLFVVKGNSYSSREMRELYARLELHSLTKLFSLVTTVYLCPEEDSLESACRELRSHLSRGLESSRAKLKQACWSFSAPHLEKLFRLRLNHVAKSQLNDFLTIESTRMAHSHMKSDLTVEYLAEVIHYGQQRLVSYQSTSSLVASSLLLDAYPHGCHMFEPGYTFDSLYAGLLRASVLKVYTRNESFPDFMAGEVRKAFIRLWNRHSDSGMTRNVLHQQVLSAGRPLWKHFKSSKCCTACFTNTAVHVQKCGHTLCDLCVQRHGITEGPEYCYSIARCPLCAAEAELLVRVKPPTSGVRLLTIDGGGCRGVIPLQFLTLLQEQIGEGCSVMELFDLAVGTSSGGLIVLSLFLYGWSPRKGLRIFEEVASKLFTRTAVKTNFGPKIQEYLRWWLSDGKYSGSTVDQCFKSIFGESRSLFGWAERQRSGTRVAVTTTSVPDASCVLLTSYNASMPRTKRIGYETPQHSTFEGGLKVWQAARATTAAPGYFPPAELSSRVLQDGALCYNNPIDVGSREARIIWPQNNFPDVVLSLGTGTTVGKEVDRPQRIVKLPRVAHNFLYGFVPRITKSVAKQFDGHNAWTNYSNRSLGCVQAQEFRLDLQLDNAPAIDDTASMPSLKAMVADQPGGGAMRAELATALLTASFFFELTALPRYIGGRYHCHGVIRCRNSAPELLSRLEDLCGTPLEFVKDNSYLGTISALDDICFECSRYGKKIAFHVTSLTDMVLLCLRSPMQPQCRLSGFPQNMQWFCERQGLDACFGASGGFLSKRDCGSCRSTKRKGEIVSDTGVKRANTTDMKGPIGFI